MVKAPLAAIFRRGIIGNVLNACWFQCAGFVTYYSINALFATHLQTDLRFTRADRDRRSCSPTCSYSSPARAGAGVATASAGAGR